MISAKKKRKCKRSWNLTFNKSFKKRDSIVLVIRVINSTAKHKLILLYAVIVVQSLSNKLTAGSSNRHRGYGGRDASACQKL